ncbi:MAG: acyl-CoA thioester hydrolase [Gaiellales bacterium]|nr:acyl-CoA thioester hydrolase [Gaiellales bacterium]
MATTKRIEIRWRDLDGFGHVNNAVYMTYLEEARDEMYTELLGEVVHRMVMRHTSVDFRSGLVQEDDEIEVATDIIRVGKSSVTTRETVTALSDGRVAAVAETVMVHTDDTRNASAPFPDSARELLEGALCVT